MDGHFSSIQGNVTMCRHFLAISCHVALMFFKCAGKNVATMIVADEVQSRAASGFESGAD